MVTCDALGVLAVSPGATSAMAAIVRPVARVSISVAEKLALPAGVTSAASVCATTVTDSVTPAGLSCTSRCVGRPRLTVTTCLPVVNPLSANVMSYDPGGRPRRT